MNWNKGGPGAKRGFGFGGFSLATSKKEEPRLSQPSHSSFGATGSGYSKTQQLPSFYKIGTKRANFDEENAYFEDDEEESSSVDLPYIPAENSPTRQQFQSQGGDSDSEEDPLDAFMAEVEDQANKDLRKLEDKEKEKKPDKGIRDDIEEEDDQEAYFRYMAENPTAGLTPDEEEDNVEYDSDGNPIAPAAKKIIMPLPPIDHSEIDYPPFEKNFFNEHEELNSLTPLQVVELRQKLNLRVSGAAPPKPCTSFAHFGFDEQLMHQIRKSEYTQPTPIQCQGVPIALSGRDMIGIAKTGSGKTAAFIWPMLVHIMDQKELQPGEGPIAVIVCPTRELCQQIHAECKRFGKAYALRSVAVYGGGSMWEQAKALQDGAEIVVCTPGRLIDHVKKKATSLQRVTYLVFDEADRMFDMGFEYQVRSIASHVRPDRQTLLFSATFRKKIERLARDILVDPIRVVQGDIGEANEDVTQVVEVLPSGLEKWGWLTRRLVEFTSAGSVLIFVTKKANSEELATNLTQEGYSLGLLHGDMDQSERNKVIADFKKKNLPVLVATDVAARGLDIPSIRTVVNYDVARDIDTHTHRIGRTGRAGEKGVAYTLLTNKDTSFAGDLVRNLEGANQNVPKELMDLAMQNPWFRKSRFKGGKGKKLNIGGGGLGYRERPGLGADTSQDRGGAGSGSSVLSNYESYKPSTGAMGDRMSAMKQAFQAQYKNHFVAASGFPPKLTNTNSSSSSGWTSAGSLSSVPSGDPQEADRCRVVPPTVVAAPPLAQSTGTRMAGFTSAGALSSLPDSYANLPQGYPAPPSAREAPRDRHGDSRDRHGDGHYRHGERSDRHGGDRDRYGDRERHGDRDRYGDRERYGSGRYGDSRNGEGSRRDREGRGDRDEWRGDREGGDRVGGEGRGDKGERAEDSFAVPDPPKRKKTRWDN
ncbi:ATP-dependent RNA helicase DDX42-like isoform X1 [Megalops cyprinoides]|uniref:ATP-dependent RNA helicase DDX42-like isoform X1 n=1 Tax=Megalops cyprinoides TaxID=118141 RepID=UPI001864EB00|nr:ATP-dependent RNA helicase DDX42-like isoform X1 [Megalops cyprinoides]XP_036391160.1 ATP-dependent RNA helicase DDX42-like isoform X1 [Megalops cyprinoides]XP_036391169.1 ATP-dependent RNA helicase DDX42-like isoform X1 [Megalops cyprinoides]